MKLKLIVGLMISLLLFTGLSGCNGIFTSETDRFVGTWECDNGEKITFFSDGTLSYLANYSGVVINIPTSGTYEIKDGKFVLHLNDRIFGYITIASDYYFSDNDTTLTFTSIDTGLITVYTKI